MHKTLLLFVIFISLFSNVFAENDERIFLEQMTTDQRVKVKVFWPDILPDELYEIELIFINPQTNKRIFNILSFDVLIQQGEKIIENYQDLITRDGRSHIVVLFPEDSEGAAQLKVTINSILEEDKLMEINESLIFDIKVVPEFSTFAIAVMALSIMSVLILLKKFKLSSKIISNIQAKN